MNRSVSRGLVAVCLVAVTASSMLAQEDGGQRRPRGFGGGFGFGGGLGGLVAMKEVQDELKLDAEKIAALTKALEELRPQQGAGGGFEGFRDLSQEERDKRMAEFRKQMEETAKKVEEKIKSSVSEEQWKRLNELRLQREGASALERSDVAGQLKLSAEQKDKIKSLASELRPQFGRRGGDNGGERPNFEEMRARREKLTADIFAVLTPEQKEVYEGLKGAKFDFPERRPGGEGGGRPGRGQRSATE